MVDDPDMMAAVFDDMQAHAEAALPDELDDLSIVLEGFGMEEPGQGETGEVPTVEVEEIEVEPITVEQTVIAEEEPLTVDEVAEEPETLTAEEPLAEEEPLKAEEPVPDQTVEEELDGTDTDEPDAE